MAEVVPVIEWVDRPDDQTIVFDCADDRCLYPIGKEIEVFDFGVPQLVVVTDVKVGKDNRGNKIHRITLTKVNKKEVE